MAFLSGLVPGLVGRSRRGLAPGMASPRAIVGAAALQSDSMGWPDPEWVLEHWMPRAPARPDRPAAQANLRNSASTNAEIERVRQANRMKGINGFGYVPAKGDVNQLARALFAEAADAPQDMDALAFAIVNRVRPRHRGGGRPEIGATLDQVLRRPRQYSFMPNEGGNGPQGSPNWALSGAPRRMTNDERKAFAQAVESAERALSGRHEDPTRHATFYFSSHTFDGSAADAPGDFFRNSLNRQELTRSPYRSPYSGSREHRPHHFFVHAADEVHKP